MSFSTRAEFDQAFACVRKTFDTGKTKDKAWRKRQLQRVWWMLEDNKEKIHEAVYKDLGKHRHESLSADYAAIQNDVLHTINNLDKWTADERPARTDLVNFLGGTTVRKEPLGVVLIIAAWNYPFLLLLQPMLAAIAAGCAVILKPSDVAEASQNLLMEIVPQYLDQDAIRCISAGAKEMPYILEHRFDHIFYTGSSNIAKFITAAAAKHLTPVTLELGGQGPAVVCETADIDLSAKRIAGTKFMNAGQICLNVNHVFVDPVIKDKFLDSLTNHFDTFLGGRDQSPEYYTKIINERNFDRLDQLLANTSGRVVYGGKRDKKSLFFGPTVVTGVKPGDSLLSEELFGPILPIIDANLDTAISTIKSMEHPLALYPFTTSKGDKDRILSETQSGGVTFNDCYLHYTAKDAPFGGVGNSGTGYYHGPHGVRTFSHLRTFIDPPLWVEKLMSARYPPYTMKKAENMLGQFNPNKPNFDRDGNETGFAGVRVAKTALFAVLFGLVSVVLYGPQKLGSFLKFKTS